MDCEYILHFGIEGTSSTMERFHATTLDVAKIRAKNKKIELERSCEDAGTIFLETFVHLYRQIEEVE